MSLKSGLAYAWAFLATPVVLVTFFSLGGGSPQLFVRLTGARISPRLVAGEVVRTVEHAGYKTLLRQPVFDGLFGPRATGFVLVEWAPAKDASLPARIEERIDYDNDGTADFAIALDVAAGRATLGEKSPRVLDVERVFNLKENRAVKVALRREGS